MRKSFEIFDTKGEGCEVKHVEDVALPKKCWSYEKPISSSPPVYGADETDGDYTQQENCTRFVIGGNVDFEPHPVINGRYRAPRFDWREFE